MGVVASCLYISCIVLIHGVTEENAKWLMNILWEMDGMDLNLNTQISKHLADLGQTLTTLTSEEGGVSDQYNKYQSDASSYSLSSTDSDREGADENVCYYYHDAYQLIKPMVIRLLLPRKLV